MQNLSVDLARTTDLRLVRNLLNLYVYDMSQWFKFDPDDEGFYNYEIPDFDAPDHFVYIANYADSPAGLALLRKEQNQYDMKEFFVLRRYRGTSTASDFLEDLLKRHPGNWQVRVFADNKPAVPFWQKAITNLTHDKFTKTNPEIEDKHWVHYHFSYPST